MTLHNLLLRIGAVAAGGEGRRMIYQGAVRFNGDVIRDFDFEIPSGRHVISVGKSSQYYISLFFGRLLWSRRRIRS